MILQNFRKSYWTVSEIMTDMDDDEDDDDDNEDEENGRRVTTIG